MVCPCYFNSGPQILKFEYRIIVILGYFATVHAIIRRILLVLLFSVVNQVNQSGIHSILMLKLIVGFSKIRSSIGNLEYLGPVHCTVWYSTGTWKWFVSTFFLRELEKKKQYSEDIPIIYIFKKLRPPNNIYYIHNMNYFSIIVRKRFIFIYIFFRSYLYFNKILIKFVVTFREYLAPKYTEICI